MEVIIVSKASKSQKQPKYFFPDILEQLAEKVQKERRSTARLERTFGNLAGFG